MTTDRSSTSFAEAEEELHEAAIEAVGFDDFGDPGYLEGLRVLLDAYDEEARFTDDGGRAARLMIVDTLRQRLRAERAWQAHPEVLDHAIERPLVICGLVRTGSTALHALMGQDPDVQPLQYWLARNPQPRPPRSTWRDHPDFRASDAEIQGMYDADPSLKAVHFMRADGPEECRHLLMQQFTDDAFEVNATVPSYSAWYAQADMLPSYERHRDLLKLIGSNDVGTPWLLKYPVHMRYMADFLEVYPDACVIQTHRDPLTVLPGYISLIAGFRAMNEERIDRQAIAEQVLDQWADGCGRMIALRKRRDPARFYDVQFADFMSNPIGTVEAIYAHFGRTLSAAGKAALEAWQSEHPEYRRDRHENSTSAEDIGIDRKDILDRFSAYMEQHGMKPEA